MFRTSASLLVGTALVTLGCDPDEDGSTGSTTAPELPCADETRDDDYAVGLSKSGAIVTAEFVDAMPAPPAGSAARSSTTIGWCAGSGSRPHIESPGVAPSGGHLHGQPSATDWRPITGGWQRS